MVLSLSANKANIMPFFARFFAFYKKLFGRTIGVSAKRPMVDLQKWAKKPQRFLKISAAWYGLHFVFRSYSKE